MKWPLTPELSIYQMLSNKTYWHKERNVQDHSFLLVCFLNKWLSSPVNPSHTKTQHRRATNCSQKLQKQPPTHVPQFPYFQNNKTETEVKITKQQEHPKQKTEASSTFRYWQHTGKNFSETENLQNLCRCKSFICGQNNKLQELKHTAVIFKYLYLSFTCLTTLFLQGFKTSNLPKHLCTALRENLFFH